jgi:hypothetical protein
MNLRRGSPWWPALIAAAGGFAVCYAVMRVSGRGEAWDAPEYFSIGIPLMCVIVFVLAWLRPRHPWRWTLAMAAGQAGALALGGGSLSLWPLAVIAMAVVSLPQFLAGFAAGWLARRLAGKSDDPA